MWLRLDGRGPRHRQLYCALRVAILEGRLPPGERLPSSRALAEELGLARNTILQALEQLGAEGYLETRERSGTFVATSLRAALSPERSERNPARRTCRRPVSRFAGRLRQAIPSPARTVSSLRRTVDIDFRYGEPAFEDLPLATWARLLARRAGRLSRRHLSYPDPSGAVELREAVARYLARARGVVCTPERVVVTTGSQQAISMASRLLVEPRQPVVLEEPHYFGFSWNLSAIGARLVPVPADDQGLRIADLRRVRSAQLVCVTPSHQFPRGGILPLSRRLELLRWARERGALILEDDYDSEFRYDGAPIEALQSLDSEGRVMYIGTTSKVLFPGLRIGWIVLPEALVGLFRDARAAADVGSSTLEQLALADLIDGGFYERHIRRARRRHAARREALLDALQVELGPRARVYGEASGLHVLLALEELPAQRARALREACRARRVAVYGANRLYLEPPRHTELLLGYGALNEEAIQEGVRRIRRALDGLRRGRAA